MASTQIYLLLSGAALFILLRYGVSSLTRKLPLAQTEKSRGFVLLGVNP